MVTPQVIEEESEDTTYNNQMYTPQVMGNEDSDVDNAHGEYESRVEDNSIAQAMDFTLN